MVVAHLAFHATGVDSVATGTDALLLQTISWKAFLAERDSNVAGHVPLDNVDRMHEREPIGIFVGLQGGFMHQAANGKVRHQQDIDLQFHQSDALPRNTIWTRPRYCEIKCIYRRSFVR